MHDIASYRNRIRCSCRALIVALNRVRRRTRTLLLFLHELSIALYDFINVLFFRGFTIIALFQALKQSAYLAYTRRDKVTYIYSLSRRKKKATVMYYGVSFSHVNEITLYFSAYAILAKITK